MRQQNVISANVCCQVCKAAIHIHSHRETIYGHILSYLCTSIHRQEQPQIHDSLLSTTRKSSSHTLPRLLSMQHTRNTHRGMAIFEHQLFTNIHAMTPKPLPSITHCPLPRTTPLTPPPHPLPSPHPSVSQTPHYTRMVH